MDDERRHTLAREIDLDLVFVPWAETVNISAMTGRGTRKIV
jgi:GTP-binding protein